MSHIVIYRSNDGQAVYHQTEKLEEAARHVEWLRNSGQGSDARIFRMQEVPIEVKTYYRVELAATDEAQPAPATPAPTPAPASAVAANKPASAPAPAPAPAAPASPAPVAVKPETAGAGAGPGANGGRFGLFGKG